MGKIENKPREVYLTGYIDFDTVNQVKQKIIEITNKDNELEKTYKEFTREPILLYIDSYGGSVYTGLGLVDLIENNKTPIYTVCLGSAMSMAFWIFIMGKKRYVGDRATLMFHDVSTYIWDKAEGIKQELKELERLQSLIKEDIIIQSDGMVSEDTIQNFVERKAKWYIPSKEAIRLHLADEYYCNIGESDNDNSEI